MDDRAVVAARDLPGPSAPDGASRRVPAVRIARRLAQDFAILGVALLLAYGLEGRLAPGATFFLGAVLPAAAAYPGLFFWSRHWAVLPRYVAITDFLDLFRSSAALVLATAIGSFLTFARAPEPTVAGSFLVAPLLFGFFSFAGLAAFRIFQRALAWRPRPDEASKPRRRTIIAGAGDAGEATVRELSRAIGGVHDIVGLVDDAPEKQHVALHGRPVLGNLGDLPRLIHALSIQEVLIAIPSARGEVIRRVFDLCSGTRARVRTLPSVAEVAGGGEALSKQFREIEIEDLLRRTPVETDLRTIAGYLSGEHVMITGGGGSIGSELARQIARLGPASLILVGKGENSIYEIEQELIQTSGFTPIAVIADVRDALAMERVFAEYRPTVVFHAAAHKHVPLMQRSPYEAIRNNVFGTLTAAELAVRYGVKRFILISTDKAVKPSSVMGATKRICEKIVTALAVHSETGFSAVRFGNVLGSRGSLIPLLKAQIKRGGPVRITHSEMTRFFMTIPEAVQLVVQAGAIGSRGEVFVLDMGAPVRIEDLAMELIRMHGLQPGVDIGIQYTGMRPGEKLHEELLYDAEDLVPTSHPKIRMVGNPRVSDLGRLKAELAVLMELAHTEGGERCRQYLMELAWDKNAVPLL